MKTLHLDSIYELTPDLLNRLGVKYLFLDVDNTIKKYAEILPSDRTKKFIYTLKSAGIEIVLCSNNFKSRVKPYAQALGCKFVSFAMKPSPYGFIRAMIKTKAKHGCILVAGDQVFNDILAGKLFFVKTLLVKPIDSQNEPSTVTARRRLFSRFEKMIWDNDITF